MNINFRGYRLWVEFLNGDFCHFPSGRLTAWVWNDTRGSVDFIEIVLRK